MPRLVLTRKPSESVVCYLPDGTGGQVRVVFTVVAVSPGRVRVGISAPETVKILRSELEDRAPEGAK